VLTHRCSSYGLRVLKRFSRKRRAGQRTDRAQLRRALGSLAKGDVLMVTRLDRLARSTRDLLNTLISRKTPH
jgi:DNA invertase Pin-like site-specific DNA recombinase